MMLFVYILAESQLKTIIFFVMGLSTYKIVSAERQIWYDRSFISNTGGFDNRRNDCQNWVFLCEIPGIRDVWIS